MSEYQYYEFCQLDKPLSQETRKKMTSLSSRAHVSSHGASYVYNYGDFRGDPKQLLLKYFDVFFYIANWGTVQLMFKYPAQKVDIGKLKKYCIKDAISCKQHTDHILLDIRIYNEDGWGWVEGEGLLPNILPLYDEIKAKNYQFLQLVTAINNEFMDEEQNSLSKLMKKITKLSSAQRAFLKIVGFDHKGKNYD